jgi:zinc transporter, ZIP family
METTVTPAPPRKAARNTLLLFLVPLVVLAGVIALFVSTNGAGLNVQPAAPLETVQFTRTILRPGEIRFHVQNTSPQDLTITQIAINDAFWPFTASPRTTIPRLGTAVFTLRYPWVEGETYAAKFVSSSGIAFETDIPVATTTATASPATLWSFTLIGLYVGIIPVLLGLCWYPALRRLGRRSMMFLMALTAGLLVYLGIDATNEGLEVAGEVGSAFQGVGLDRMWLIVTTFGLTSL